MKSTTAHLISIVVGIATTGTAVLDAILRAHPGSFPDWLAVVGASVVTLPTVAKILAEARSVAVYGEPITATLEQAVPKEWDKLEHFITQEWPSAGATLAHLNEWAADAMKDLDELKGKVAAVKLLSDPAPQAAAPVASTSVAYPAQASEPPVA